MQGVAVYRGDGYEYAFRLCLVVAPCGIQADVFVQIFLQYGSVQGAYRPNVQLAYLCQQVFHLYAVFAYDVEVVPSSLASPVVVIATAEAAFS